MYEEAVSGWVVISSERAKANDGIRTQESVPGRPTLIPVPRIDRWTTTLTKKIRAQSSDSIYPKFSQATQNPVMSICTLDDVRLTQSRKVALLGAA